MMEQKPKASSATPAIARASFGPALRQALAVPDGIDVEVPAAPSGPVVVPTTPDAATWMLAAQLTTSDGARRPVILRGLRMNRKDSETWCRIDQSLIASPITEVSGLPRAVVGRAGAEAALVPPLFYCAEKRVLVSSPDAAAPDGRAALWQLARRGSGEPAVDVPCLTCDERERCYPASGPSADRDTAGTRLLPICDGPWSGWLVEGCHLPWSAWIRLASGEPWVTVRTSLAQWPPALTADADRVLAVGRPTILGPEHGESFALESLLLRLEWLRQTLTTIRDLNAHTGGPHLGLCPEAFAAAIGTSGVLRSSLWSSRSILLSTSAAHVLGSGEFEPLPGRSAAMVPPECQGGAAWVQGRCLPRGNAKTITAAKSWEFHFIPSESVAKVPAKGTPVRFAINQDGEPAGAPINGRIDTAFRDVWVVTVGDPIKSEPGLREMLSRDDGRPAIVIQPVSDHGLADDLFAIGTLWLSTLVAEPGELGAAVRLRSALRGAAAGTSSGDAPELGEPLFYSSTVGRQERRLPRELLDAALELGNRMCGGIPQGYPGQNHEPVPSGARLAVYATMLADASMIAAEAKNRLFGFPAADAQIRSVLEGALDAD